MLLDVRTYDCKPNSLPQHLALYEKLGKPVQTKHLGQPFAFMTCETGNPNQYVHIWMYDNASDREIKRAALAADPAWIAYRAESAKLGALLTQENKLMNPVGFFNSPKT